MTLRGAGGSREGYSICGDSHRPVSCSFVAWCSLLSPLQCRTPNLSSLVGASHKQITRLHRSGWEPFNCKKIKIKNKNLATTCWFSCVSFVQFFCKTFGHLWVCVYVRVYTTFMHFLFITICVTTRKTQRWKKKKEERSNLAVNWVGGILPVNSNGFSSSEKPMNKHTEEMDESYFDVHHRAM